MYFKVPIIAVFTKYDQFKLDVEMELEDAKGGEGVLAQWVETEAERLFNVEYLGTVGGMPPYVRLQSESLAHLLHCG